MQLSVSVVRQGVHFMSGQLTITELSPWHNFMIIAVVRSHADEEALLQDKEAILQLCLTGSLFTQVLIRI